MQPAAEKLPFHIPVSIGLLDRNGAPLKLSFEGGEHDTVVLELTEARQQWTFEHIDAQPVPSLLRDFSAPVVIDYAWEEDELALLSAHDTNPFARWEAGQELASRQILAVAARQATGAQAALSEAFIGAWRALLSDTTLDAAYQARALALPSEKTLAERMSPIEPPALAAARDAVREILGRTLRTEWQAAWDRAQTPGAYSPAPIPAGKRALKNLALTYLLAGGDKTAADAARAQYAAADNMTDSLAALGALVSYAGDDARTQTALDAFYTRWAEDPLVVDKWFALQATARTTTVDTMRELMQHPAFTLRNPNRARALIFQFCLNNARGLHRADGVGYAFWAEQVLALNAINPEIAARLARALDSWARFTPALRDPMQHALTSIRAHPGLSRNVQEIVSKALDLAA